MSTLTPPNAPMPGPVPPEFGPYMDSAAKLGPAAAAEITKAYEKVNRDHAGHRQHQRRARAAQQQEDDNVFQERHTTRMIETSDRGVQDGPYPGNRRRLSSPVYYVSLLLFGLIGWAIDVDTLLNVGAPLVLTVLMATLGAVAIVCGGHLLGGHLKRRSQSNAPGVHFRAGTGHLMAGLASVAVVVIVVLAALRMFELGLLGGVFLLGVMLLLLIATTVMAFLHTHDGEDRLKRAARSTAKARKRTRLAFRQVDLTLGAYRMSLVALATLAGRWVYQFETLSAAASMAWLVNHPDADERSAPVLPEPEWVGAFRRLAAGEVPVELQLPTPDEDQARGGTA